MKIFFNRPRFHWGTRLSGELKRLARQNAAAIQMKNEKVKVKNEREELASAAYCNTRS